MIFPVFYFWEEIYLFLIILIYKWFCLSVIFCECFPIFSWFSANITTYWKQLLPLLVLDLIVAFLLFDPFWKIYAWSTTLNPLSANSTKWSNTLKQFVGCSRQIVSSVFDHFVWLALKGLIIALIFLNFVYWQSYQSSKSINLEKLINSITFDLHQRRNLTTIVKLATDKMNSFDSFFWFLISLVAIYFLISSKRTEK